MIQLILKLIGKTILDSIGWTEKLGGVIQPKIEPILEIDNLKDFWLFKADIEALEKDPVQIDLYLKEHGLDKVKGLKDYILNNDIKQSSVNNLIQTQNYKNIADQAHGFLGVKKAIDEYNDSLIKNEDGTTKASDGTKKLSETISQSNSSLGKYLTNLKGADAGMIGYAGSLATATIKTFALEAATMAMNAAVSYGISFVISGIITAITDYLNRVDNAIEASHRAKETIDEANSTFKAQQELVKESGKKYAELSQHVNQLNNTNLDLKEDEYKEFLDISNQIAEQFPGLIKGYDDNGNAILNLNGTVSYINSTLDTYIEKAKKASQVKIVQAFKGEGDNEDYFKGAKYEVDELNGKVTDAKNEIENLQKFKEKINLHKDDLTDRTSEDLFGNYPNSSDARLKSDYVRKYLEESGFDKRKLNDISGSLLLSGILSDEEGKELYDAINEMDKDLDGKLSDSAILTIDEILSKHSKESGYNISDYITKQINQQIETATDNYNQFAEDVETKNQEISQNAQTVLEQSAIWSNPDTTDQVKTTMTNALGKIDWSDKQFEGFDGEQAANYIQTTFASSFEKLSDNDKITVDKFFSADPDKINLTEYISLYKKIKEIFEKHGIKIPINIEDSKKVEDDFNKSLEQMSDKDKETVKRYLKDNSIDSASKLDVWNKRTEGITNATDAIEAYEKKAQEVSHISSKDTPLSFSEVWDSIGTTGDKDAKKAEKEEKKRLKELAEAGKLTEEELSKSSLAKKFEDAGVSIAKATKEINKFKSSADQLASMKTGISSISSILGEKKEKQSSKKTRNEGIGADTLAGMPDDLKDQKKEYEHFVEVLGDGSSSMEECRKAANKLATAYVNSNNFLSKLTDKTKNYYTSVLTEMGVENAAQVVQQSLNTKKVDEMLLNWDIVNATEEEIAAKAAEVGALEGANQALKDYAFQKALASKGTLDTSSSVANLITLAKQCGVTGDSLKELQKLQILLNESTSISENKSMSSIEKALRLGSLSGQIAAQQGKLNSIAKKKVKVGSTAGLGIKPKRSGSSKTKGDKSSKSSKNTKQEMNWLERRLTRMQSIIDLTASKLQNLFSVKAKNNNLDKQIKQTTKLMKQYGVAAKRYQTKADSVAKGSTKKIKSGKNKGKKKKVKPLSKSIIKKIQSGKLTKAKAKKLFKNYNQSYYDRISSYIDWYMTCHFA